MKHNVINQFILPTKCANNNIYTSNFFHILPTRPENEISDMQIFGGKNILGGKKYLEVKIFGGENIWRLKYLKVKIFEG